MEKVQRDVTIREKEREMQENEKGTTSIYKSIQMTQKPKRKPNEFTPAEHMKTIGLYAPILTYI